MYGLKPLKEGDKYGRRKILGDVKKDNGQRKELVECECGTVKYVSRRNLVKGISKSCGCYRADDVRNRSIKHGDVHTRLYKIYEGMRTRCYNKNAPYYKNYGGRGIIIEREDYEHFKSDMYESYKKHCDIFGEYDTTIDRIDNNGNYSKDNCTWSTRTEQQGNRRNTELYERKGEYMTLPQIYRIERPNLRLKTFCTRVRRGTFTIQDALTTPLLSIKN